MPIIRKQLKSSDVYPDDLRYNPATDAIESNVNGDWIDNPDADPRHQTTYPPRITDNTACDAAQSVVDALKSQIDGVLAAIDNGSTLFAIAGIILSIFTFGAYAVFVGLALGIGDQMLGFGTTAIEAALSAPAYETLRCILFCHMDGNGRISAAELEAATADVTAQVGGIGATIMNSMLRLAGEGGVNNLASLGTATGDCSDCDCGWCYAFDFTLSEAGWSEFVQCTTGSVQGANGWQGNCNSCGYFDTTIQITFDGHLTHIEYDVYLDAASTLPDTGILRNGETLVIESAAVGFSTHQANGDWTGSNHLVILANCQCATFTRIKSVTLRGSGENPFGENNC